MNYRTGLRPWIITCAVLSVGLGGMDAKAAGESQINPSEARQAAGRWTAAVGAQRTVGDARTLRGGGGIAAYCYELEPDGFLIVSARRDAHPVLAHSDHGALPERGTDQWAQLEAWVARTSYSDIESARQAWDGLLTASAAAAGPHYLTSSKGPLLTSAWSQGPPFADDCPTIVGETQEYQTPVGCVPLAISQIMNYHQWPTYGFGELSYEWDGVQCTFGDSPAQTLSASYGDSYDWSSMPAVCTYNIPCLPAQEAAVAELCYEVAVSEGTDFGCTATIGAFVFPENLRYHHQAIETVNREDFTDQEWFDLLKAEIDANRPVYYSLNVPQLGPHAAVCDGWKIITGSPTTYWFHMNFGWGGTANGWYQIDDMYSEGSASEGAGINIRPNRIYHPALQNQEEDGEGYEVVARFEIPGGLVSGSTKVYYYLKELDGTPISGPTMLTMTSTGGVAEYAATIPDTDPETIVEYYISCAVNPPGGGIGQLPVTHTYPLEAPDTRLSFEVYEDVVGPSVSHAPIPAIDIEDWPVEILVIATDYRSEVESVEVEWSIEGVAQTTISLAANGSDPSIWTGSFSGTVEAGDAVTYRIVATDTALTPNETFVPLESADPHMFAVLDLVLQDFEDGFGDWTVSTATEEDPQWWVDSESPLRNGNPMTAAHCSLNPFEDQSYGELADERLETPAFFLGIGSTLTFWHHISAGTRMGGSTLSALDGGVLEASVDGGEVWTAVSPVGGYDLSIYANSDNPINEDHDSCWSGIYGWRFVTVDLGDLAGETVSLRFRFGSDSSDDEQTYRGWYIDDVTWDLGVAGEPRLVAEIAELPSGTLRVLPNPARSQVSIRFGVSQAVVSSSVEIIDVAGRRVQRVWEGALPAGEHVATWDGRRADGKRAVAGVYFVRAQIGAESLNRRLLLLD